MRFSDAERIIKEEDLYNINWYNENNMKENQVGIAKHENEWIVYVTDERASVVPASISRFSSEDKAFDTLIRKARYGKKYLL